MTTRKRFTLDWGKALLIGAGTVQGYQYAGAFRLIHQELGAYALAGGAIAGTVVAGTIAYAGNRLPGLRAKAARRWGTGFFIGLLCLSPLVLTPVNWFTMHAGLRAILGWYAWILAGLVASLPEIALGLVALVDRSLLPAQPTAGKDEATEHLRKSTKKYNCKVVGCGYATNNQHSYASHMGHHRKAEQKEALVAGLFGKKQP